MQNTVSRRIALLLLLGIFLASASGFAGDIKSRFKARLPVIKALKAKGIVGENNRGYLQFIGGKKEQENVVIAENNDRRKVYAAIAQREGTTERAVGKRRALHIAQKVRPGEWLQDADGNWHQQH